MSHLQMLELAGLGCRVLAVRACSPGQPGRQSELIVLWHVRREERRGEERLHVDVYSVELRPDYRETLTRALGPQTL